MHNINIILSVISANIKNNEKYILSTDNTKIIFPIFRLSDSNIENNIIEYLKTVFVLNQDIKEYINYIQLISINNRSISQLFSNNDINILYGLTIPTFPTKDNYFWKTFNFMDTNIPNELTIIGDTIKYSF